MSEDKSMAPVYTNNSVAEKEILSTGPFQIAESNLKYIAIKLTNYAEDLHDENHTTFKKEREEDIETWRNLSCSWIGKISIFKIHVLSKVIYRFNAMPNKIPTTFFSEIENIQKFICNHKRQQIAKTTLSGHQTVWYWYRNREEDQRNRRDTPQGSPHMDTQLIFDKKPENNPWRKPGLFHKAAGTTG